jgi:hypothetical protein
VQRNSLVKAELRGRSPALVSKGPIRRRRPFFCHGPGQRFNWRLSYLLPRFPFSSACTAKLHCPSGVRVQMCYGCGGTKRNTSALMIIVCYGIYILTEWGRPEHLLNSSVVPSDA